MVAATVAAGRVAEAARVRVAEGTVAVEMAAEAETARVAEGTAAEARAVAARGWAVVVKEVAAKVKAAARV